MRDTRAAGGKQADASVVELDAVCMPDIVTEPAELLGILRRRAVEPFPRVGQVVVVLGQVRVQTHAQAACQQRRLAHQVAADAER